MSRAEVASMKPDQKMPVEIASHQKGRVKLGVMTSQ